MSKKIDRWIPVSKLNTLIYCPRRFWYEHIDGIQVHNHHTIEGEIRHKHVDRQDHRTTTQKGVETTRSLYLSSERLGIIAKIDVVEDKQGQIRPLEYKKGRPGDWLNDKVQLCAQGMLLEEHHQIELEFGYLYYFKTNQKIVIQFNPTLRQETLRAIERAQALCTSGEMPPRLVNSNKCSSCSLEPICLPHETNALQSSASTTTTAKVLPRLDWGHTLYVDRPGVLIGKQADQILVKSAESILEKIPLVNLNQIVVAANATLTTPAMKWCLKHHIPVTFLSSNGRYYGSLTPEVSKNVSIRIAQFKAAFDPDCSLTFARQFVTGKIKNMRTFLMRMNRTRNDDQIQHAVNQLKKWIRKIDKVEQLESLLGLEGSATAIYFGVFGKLIKTPLDFQFEARHRRPPTDPVNALLSLGYSLLTQDVFSACSTVGLDPYLGYLHQPGYGKPALALDIMEEFRPIIVDSVVLTLINNGMLKPTHFIQTPYQSCLLTETGRKAVYAAYEKRMNTDITHPVFRYTISYRRAIEVQIRMFAKRLLGEIDTYQPFHVR
ncbi:MAG: type I-D CRISPR-associated endonuclease Cas1 [Gemmatimonadetes bacterium]|nr:MAG: type I-D CRISPR-associated endonuclease Cas1 [Gemmatimonadota bacterium]